MQGVEGIEERRRGGLCHRVEEFGGAPPVPEAGGSTTKGEIASEEDGGLGLSIVGRVEERKLGETF